MSSALGFCTFICFILSIIYEVESAISYPPSNTVAELNGEAIFNCSTNSPTPPYAWILSRDGTTSGAISIATGCVVSIDLRNHYRTEQPSGQATCNLVIFNITMEQAGVYRCIETNTYFALLTVIDPAPNMTHNNTLDVMDGENVVITCTLNYNGSVLPASTLTPHFYWTSYDGNYVSSFYDSTIVNSHVMSQLSVKANRTAPYTCHVYLELNPTALTGYASNVPPVDSSASSSTMPVFSVPPSTPPSVVSESTATIATTGSTTAGSSGDNCHVSVAAAIAVGAILFISLALNIMLLIILIKNMRPKHDPFKRAGTSRTILSPETLDLSNEPPAQAAYEELTRSNEIHLQPTYDKLTPKPLAPATYQELTHPNEIHLQPPTYEKLATKPSSYVDDLS